MAAYAQIPSLSAALMLAALPLCGQSVGPHWARFSRSGLRVGSDDGAFGAEVHLRGQFRYSGPFETPPRQAADFLEPEGDRLELRRGRLKIGGHALRPWLHFKFDFAIPENRSLDAKVTIAKLPWLQLSGGQWKVDYQREQIDSSGDQQFAERSIVNREFSFSRQKGVGLHGRIGKGRVWDSEYWSEVFLGNGQGFLDEELNGKEHGDGSPLWSNRYQWNVLHGGVDFSQSDIERSPAPRLSLAVAGARNRSRYTLFSSSGGSQLDGFAAGEVGQYSVRQLLFDSGFKYRGVSVQHELHSKRVRDRLTFKTTRLRGGYLQAGYFFHELWRVIPKPLEVAGRAAFVDPDRDQAGLLRQLGFAVNWFFEGHDNKLTLDVSRYRLDRPGSDADRTQVRLQWDFTL